MWDMKGSSQCTSKLRNSHWKKYFIVMNDIVRSVSRNLLSPLLEKSHLRHPNTVVIFCLLTSIPCISCSGHNN